MLFLHGFPEFWWAWHQQMRLVAEAGFRAVAVDLRGYGASDKPPRGYDGYTMAGDVAGLIRALGERHATLVGAGYGGTLAWITAAFHPRLVRRLVVLSAAHPLRLRAALASDPRGQLSAALPDDPVPGTPLRTRTDQGRRRARRPVPAEVGGAGLAAHRRLRRLRAALPHRDAHPAGRVLRAGGLPVGRPLGDPHPRVPVRQTAPAAAHAHRPCTCTARWTPPCWRVPPRAPAATSSPGTSGGCSTGSATSRTWRRRTLVAGEILRWAKEYRLRRGTRADR